MWVVGPQQRSIRLTHDRLYFKWVANLLLHEMSSAQALNSGLRVLGVGLLLVGVFITFIEIDPHFSASFGLLLILASAGVSVVILSDVVSAPTGRAALLRRDIGGLSRSSDKTRRL